MCAPPPECGPAAVANVPLTTSAKPAAVKSERQAAELERDDRLGVPVAQSDRLDRDHDRTRDERHREQQVRHHDGPAQVARNREVAERRLGERAEQDGERELPRPVRQARRLPRREPGQQRDRDHDAADEAVPELDEGVDVLLGQRRSPLAARPVAAAETGVREPHRRARADDQPEEEHVVHATWTKRTGEISKLRMRAAISI